MEKKETVNEPEVQLHTKCKKCGRKLTTYESRKIGYGTTCLKKHLKEQSLARQRRLF